MNESSGVKKIGIVGAGISGLLAAYTLKQKGHQVIIWESGARAGGLIHSESYSDYVFEWGPHTILADQNWHTLFRELGLKPLIAPVEAKIRYIWKDGNCQRLPSGPNDFLKTSFFSIPEKLKILHGLFKHIELPKDDISVADLFEFIPAFIKKLN